VSYIIGSYSSNGVWNKTKITFAPVVLETEKILLAFEEQSVIKFYDDDGNLNIITGTGLDNNLKLLTENDWKNILQNETDHLDLNGHYLVIKVGSDEVTFYNDQLGLREVYFYENNGNLLFSTRLDWIIKLIEAPELDYNFLCSFWSFENPLTERTFCQGIKLLGPGGKARITKKGLSVANKSWLPEKLDVNRADVINLISQTIDSILQTDRITNLGLSGGIDSRTILALLLDYDKKLWRTTTFGQKNYADVRIANSMAKILKFHHTNHSCKPFFSDNIFGNWEDFSLETNGLLPADFYHELSYYKMLPKDDFFIDGGKGEYIRRGLSSKFSILGKNDLLSGNIDGIKKYLYSPKPPIFNQDVTQNWSKYHSEDVSHVVNSMPVPLEFGVENWVDLYNIRFRTGNASYPSQTRLDSYVQNLMPFNQPRILSAVLNLPNSDRSDEKINRDILNKKRILKLFPLARYNTVIPFQHNKYTCFVWGKLMRLIYKDKQRNHRAFIEANKEFILSRMKDTDFINNPIYEKKRIRDKVNAYFLGKSNDTGFVIWWMTFDVWNRLFY
jgi:hypothetical protein